MNKYARLFGEKGIEDVRADAHSGTVVCRSYVTDLFHTLSQLRKKSGGHLCAISITTAFPKAD